MHIYATKLFDLSKLDDLLQDMKVKILHHTARFLPLSQTFVSDMLNALDRKTFIENYILTHDVVNNSAINHLSLKDVSFNRYHPFIKKVLNAINKMRGYAHNTHLKDACNYLYDVNPDVIHCHFGTAAYFNYSLQQYSKTNIPVLISFHGYDVFNADVLFDKYQTRLVKLIERNCLCTCPSEFLKEVLIEKFNISSHKIVVVPNGFNSTLFKPQICVLKQGEILKIAHIGRFTELKGQRYLIEALAHLKSIGQSDIQLTLIGEGETLLAMQQLAANLQVEKQINFTGAISHQEVANHLGHCHLYVHPSYTMENGAAETFGVAILEALASGKPVIITDSGGMAEILPNGSHDQYAKIVKQKSSEALVQAISEFIQMRTKFNQDEFLEFRKSVLAKNNIENSSNLIIDCYNRLLSEN
jgi:glycosyltransferase involved in cell wall biosynthesis